MLLLFPPPGGISGLVFRTDQSIVFASMRKVKYEIARSLYRVGNAILGGVAFLLFRPPPDHPSTVAVVRTGHLGDTFCALPALREIRRRYPSARLLLLTSGKIISRSHPTEVLEGIFAFDGLVSFDSGKLRDPAYARGLLKKLRRERIDLLVYLGQYPAGLCRLLRDMVFYRLAGARSALGFRWDKHRLFRLAQRRSRVFPDEVSRLLRLITPPGVLLPPARWEIPSVSLPDFPGPVRGLRLIAVHPGGKYTVNRWFPERFRALIGELAEKIRPHRVVLVGGKAGEGGENLLPSADNIIDLRGKTGYRELAEVLRRCEILVTTDSGPAHVAAAVGTPVVGIYSGRDYPNCWHPHGDRHIIIRKDPDCQVCMREECPGSECLKEITVAEVAAAVWKLWERTDA